jgi:hypothetical protein
MFAFLAYLTLDLIFTVKECVQKATILNFQTTHKVGLVVVLMFSLKVAELPKKLEKSIDIHMHLLILRDGNVKLATLTIAKHVYIQRQLLQPCP